MGASKEEWDVEDDGSEPRRRRAKRAARALVSPALVARIQNGSLAAFRELVVHFQDDVFAHALALTRDLDAARAAARDVFVRAHGEVRVLTDANQVPAMLRRLVQRGTPPVDELRAPNASARAPSLSERAPANLSTSATRASSDADGETIEGEGPDFLARVLSLAFEERAVALLALAADATEAETSALLGIPAATVASRFAVAKKRVKRHAWRAVQDALADRRPSASSAFADEVLARINSGSTR